jgi:hypothetical protein
MNLNLEFENGIIQGDIVREVIETIPTLDESRFRQRKTYDEYYYDQTEITIDLNILNLLRSYGYKIVITSSTIILHY